MVARRLNDGLTKRLCEVWVDASIAAITPCPFGKFMDPFRIFRLEMLGFLVVMSAMLAYRMLTRRINLSGLLGDGTGRRAVTPERVQLLAVTVVVSVKCVVNVILNPSGALPGIEAGWLLLFGVSCVVYAVVKWLRAFRWQ
jgi:hypothetical protein